jgi:hypothetical protein
MLAPLCLSAGCRRHLHQPGRFTVYFPIVTCLVVSVVVTLLLVYNFFRN